MDGCEINIENCKNLSIYTKMQLKYGTKAVLMRFFSLSSVWNSANCEQVWTKKNSVHNNQRISSDKRNEWKSLLERSRGYAIPSYGNGTQYRTHETKLWSPSLIARVELENVQNENTIVIFLVCKRFIVWEVNKYIFSLNHLRIAYI